ncbi:MAG: ParB N-terminal domain-containing protein, partial [Planctomycetota bacterium]
MKTEMRSIESVKPYDKNPRKNDGAVDAVANSIREFGFRVPIVVDEQGVIVAGHTRLLAAQKLGLKEVPVHVAVGLTPEQIKAYRLADNKLHELSTWDYDLLPIELSDLRGMDVDLELLGFSSEELEKMLGATGTEGLTDPDAVPEPPDEAVTRAGDLWMMGEHRLLCGDSSKPEDMERLLDGARIQLVNTDPPYNVNVAPRSNNAAVTAAAGGAYMGQQGMDAAISARKHATHDKLRPRDRPLANDFISDEEFARLLRAWFGNIRRVLEPGRSFYIWGGYSNIWNYPHALKESELYFSQMIIWVKEHPVLTRKDFLGNHEWCFYGWKEGAAHWFNPEINNAT